MRYTAAMMGFFQSRLPLSTFSRFDLELLMRRTVEVVGREMIVRSSVVTRVDDLPVDRTSPASLIDTAMSAVGNQLAMRPDAIDVSVATDPEFAQASIYVDGHVQISREIIADPLAAVMEIANAYSLHFWSSLTAPRPLDTHPRTTTLLPIAMGFGLLASAASLQEKHWSTIGYSGWSMSRSGYYNAIEIGYALALVARLCGQTDPPWLRRLRPDSRRTCAAALAFFAKHQSRGGQLLFDAQRIPSSDRDPAELAAWLAGDDATFAMAAAYALAKQESIPQVAVEPALRWSASKDAEMAVVATRLLGFADKDDKRIDARIDSLIAGSIAPVTLAALLAAERRGASMGRWTKRIEMLLVASDVDLMPLVELISANADQLTPLTPIICQQAELAIDYDDEEATSALLGCLCRLTADPAAAIEASMRSPEAKRTAIAKLHSVQD